MKSNKRILIAFLILILDSSLFYSQLSGSTLGKAENGYTIGLNFGDARQLSDIPATTGGWGTSLYLGKNLFYDTDALFSFDLLSNISYSISKGLDPDSKHSPFENSILNKTDYTFFYNNHKTSLFTVGLDGKLTYNKFRTEQNWYFSMFLGGNWGIFSANMNLKDNSGNYYIDEFEKIKNDSYKDKKNKLKKIFDKKYETKAENFDDFSLKSRLMPSIGLEVGFDITDYLSFYIADRFTFTNTNTIDGEINLDGSKDFLNFAHIGFNLYFHNSKSSYTKSTPSVSEVEPISGYKIPKEVDEHNYPEVKIIMPDKRPYNSPNRDLLVKAKITNVNSVLDIYCKVNGEKVAFDYSSNYVQFVAQLEPGDNKIQIYAKNDYGQSRDVVSVYFNGGRQEASEPEIRLMSPNESVSTSEEDIFTIKAYINFVDKKEDIQILANGHPFKSYKYNPNTNEFEIKVRLASGQNNFELIAENKEGKAINSFDIYYETEPPIDNNSSSQTPTISLISPTSLNSSIYDTDLLDFKVKITNVSNKNDITFNVNGRKNRFFDYDPSNGILEDKISLFDEVTKIEIKVKNDYGTASKEITVRFGEESETKTTNPIEFIDVTKPDSDCKIDLTVRINEANRKNDLQLFLNQFQIRNFSFNKSDKILKSTLYLDEDQNIIKVIFNNGEELTNTYNIRCDLDGNYENDNSQGDGTDNEDIDRIVEKPVILIDYPENKSIIENERITFKATLNYVESKSDIGLRLNDENISYFSFDSETGEIFSDLTLITGENVIDIEATNINGKVEKQLNITYEEPLKGPPSVLINSPRNGFKTDQPTAVFRASIENIKNTENVYVILNGNDFSEFNFDLERGIIFGHLPLALGKNTLSVEAENRLGTDIDEVIFQHRLDVVPAVKIVSPKKGIVMGVAYAPLEAITQNIKNKQEVIIIINGKYYKSFKLSDEKLTSKIPLTNGENEIIVKAVNDYGESSDTTMVLFNGKPEKPIINLLNPRKANTTVSSKTFEFEAKVIGIKHSSYVDLKLNNSSISEVYYFKQDKKVKATLELRKGWNYITLNATNKTGVETVKTKIFLE